MSRLERWSPFKFQRKNGGQKQESKKMQRPSAGEQTSGLSRTTPFGSGISPLMQSMFSDPFFRDPFSRFAEMDRWFGDFSPTQFQPNVDVVEEDGNVKVSAELPGLSKDDITLQVENDVLILSGEKKNESEKKEEGAYRTERYYGYFQRAIPLPADVDQESAEAKFDHGVLTVQFRKAPDAGEKGKRIEIKA